MKKILFAFLSILFVACQKQSIILPGNNSGTETSFKKLNTSSSIYNSLTTTGPKSFLFDEPNTKFSSAEKTAILNFVKNGGGLFMISDHTNSDRNNDGWDSPDIWNDLMNSNSVQTNPFGFKIDLTDISETSSNVTTV